MGILAPLPSRGDGPFSDTFRGGALDEVQMIRLSVAVDTRVH